MLDQRVEWIDKEREYRNGSMPLTLTKNILKMNLAVEFSAFVESYDVNMIKDGFPKVRIIKMSLEQIYLLIMRIWLMWRSHRLTHMTRRFPNALKEISVEVMEVIELMREELFKINSENGCWIPPRSTDGSCT